MASTRAYEVNFLTNKTNSPKFHVHCDNLTLLNWSDFYKYQKGIKRFGFLKAVNCGKSDHLAIPKTCSIQQVIVICRMNRYTEVPCSFKILTASKFRTRCENEKTASNKQFILPRLMPYPNLHTFFSRWYFATVISDKPKISSIKYSGTMFLVIGTRIMNAQRIKLTVIVRLNKHIFIFILKSFIKT